jgi:methanogenic corrinoid protein MtbC1
MTGLSVDTLRAWERRYDAVSPRRNRRGRLYSDAQVTRLRQLSDLVGRGHAIGTIVSLSDDQLGTLLARVDAHSTPAGAAHTPAAMDPMLQALDRYDLEAIENTLSRYAVVLSPRDFVFAVLLPLLREIGRRWEAGQLRPSQEHLVSAIIRSVLGGLLRTTSRPHGGITIVCATAPGERHELGLLSGAVLAASAGYGVLYLGAEVPAADLLHAVEMTGARVVLMSATTPQAVAKSEWRKLAALPSNVELWIGGPQADGALAVLADRARTLTELQQVTLLLSRYRGVALDSAVSDIP